MRYELFVALRYLTARRKEKFVSLITLIAVLGVAIGVACIIVVQAVMAGFDNELKEKIIGANSHILVETGGSWQDYQQALDSLNTLPEVVSAAPFVNGQVILRNKDYVRGAMLRGIDPAKETKVTQLGKYLREGGFPSGRQIIVGSELADRAGLYVGAKIDVISSAGAKQYPFEVCGIFKSGMYDYDMNLVFINIRDAKEIFGLGSKISGIGVKIADPYKADRVKHLIQKSMDFPFMVRSWMDINRNLFSALQLEKTAMFIILALIVVVASFNIAGTLIMMVTQKVKDIGILKSVGTTNKAVRTIFTIEGLLIGLAGTSLGAALGFGLCFLLKRYQIIQLPKDIYYIDRLPVMVQWSDALLVIAAAMAISFLATLYPSWQASRLDPVEALRYE